METILFCKLYCLVEILCREIVFVKDGDKYYVDDDPSKGPLLRWRSSATLMYTNWLNYYVYQETPFDIGSIKSIRNEDLVPNRDLEKNG